MSKLYNQSDLDTLKQTLGSITNSIPTDKADYIWHNYQIIAKTNEGRPCNCGSSANLWRKAVTTINDYLKTNPEPTDA
jgi:hypothetical protein